MPPRTPTAERRLPIVPIVVGVVVVVLGLVAVFASRGDGGSGDTASVGAGVEQTRPVEVTGTPLPELGGSDDPAVGQVAPELHGSSFDGSAVDITADGTPKLLFFVAHWCPHCNDEVPVVTEWLDGEPSKDGVDVYAISTAVDPAAPNYPPSSWLAGENWPAPVLADDADSSAATAYGLSGFPYFVVLDGQNRLLLRGSGELAPDALDQLIAAAAAEAPA